MYKWYVYNFSFALILRITQNKRHEHDGRLIPLRCVIYINFLASHKIECLIFVEILTRFLEIENKIKRFCRMYYAIVLCYNSVLRNITKYDTFFMILCPTDFFVIYMYTSMMYYTVFITNVNKNLF